MLQARLALCAAGDADALLQQAHGIYAQLMELDPMRRGFYEDAMAGRAFVVVQALGTM